MEIDRLRDVDRSFQCPDITERLGPMYELIEARTRLYPKLARLHGKLSLIASQVKIPILFSRTFFDKIKNNIHLSSRC